MNVFNGATRYGLHVVGKRTIAVILAAALVVMGVPITAHVVKEADEAVVVEAYAASGKVLTASVPSEVGGDAAVDVAFTITGDDTCEVGRSNSSGSTSYAVASGYDGGVVIPEEIVYNDSSGSEAVYTVTSVQPYAFGNAISADVDSCSLSSVVIPYTVETVDSYAFCGCDSLEEVLFSGDDDHPAEVEEIGSYAFAWTAVESVCFPDSLVSLGQNSFRECTELVTVDFEDPEESALEYLAGTSSGDSSAYNGAFQCSESNTGSLKSITLPAGLKSVPSNSFAYQTELEEVTFLGDSLNYIGTYAFYHCSSLVELTIPALSVDSANSSSSLKEFSLCGLTSLETLVFLGDADGDEYDSDAFDDMASLETVVYWGEPFGGGNSGTGQGQRTGTAERAFGDDVDYYFNVKFYEDEEDAENETDEISSARILGDMTVGELRDVLAGDAEFEDDDVFNDGGTVPEDSADWYWAFEEGYVDSSDLYGSPVAWRCGKDAEEVEIASCRISLTTTVFTRASEPVDLSEEYEVLAPDGSEEVPSDCYTVYAIGSFTEGDGGDAMTSTVTYDDITDLTEEGSYQLWFEAVEGSGYTGSTYAEFTLSTTNIDFYAYPGETGWAREFSSNVYEGSGEYDTIIVASGGDVYGAAAAQWLASAIGAAFLVLPEGEIPDSNSDNYFNAAINNLFGEDNNGKVYVIGDEDAVSEEAEEALDTSRVTSVNRLSYSDEDAPARVWRKFSQDYDGGTTAYVAVEEDGSYSEAAAATQLAYADSCPVFFCDEDGELDSYTRFVLKTGHFDQIVAVGGDDAALEQVEYQVGDDAEYSLVEEEAQDLAYEAADEYYENHEKDTSMKAILASVDEGDEAYAVMAAVVASESDAALFLAEGESEIEEAIPSSYLGEDVAARTETMAFMGESEFLDDAQVYLSSLWDIDNEEE